MSFYAFFNAYSHRSRRGHPGLTDRAGVIPVSQIRPDSQIVPGSPWSHRSRRGHPGLTDCVGVALVSQIVPGSPRKEGGGARGAEPPPRKILRAEFPSLRFLGASPRGARSIDVDVGGLALEGPGVKTGPGELKASILTSTVALKALGSKPAPEG